MTVLRLNGEKVTWVASFDAKFACLHWGVYKVGQEKFDTYVKKIRKFFFFSNEE